METVITLLLHTTDGVAGESAWLRRELRLPFVPYAGPRLAFGRAALDPQNARADIGKRTLVPFGAECSGVYFDVREQRVEVVIEEEVPSVEALAAAMQAHISLHAFERIYVSMDESGDP